MEMFMRMRSLFLASAFASMFGILAFQNGASAANMTERGRTWEATCDSAMICRLTSDPQPPADGGFPIPSFERVVRAGSPLAMVLPSPDGFDMLSPKGVYKVSVDGREIATVKVADLARDTAGGGYVTADPAIVNPVINAARNGSDSISVTYSGPEIGEYAETDLGGFRRSLDWMQKQS